MTVVGTQIDSDKRLLEFETYEGYLDSLVTFVDLGYLGNLSIARQLAELGYRCTGETLSRDAFYHRLKAVKDLLFPIYKPYNLTSELVIPSDNVMQELALREHSNRLKIISTIIFVRNLTKLQFEISGYIDFSERLEKENWLPYFQGRKKIWPCASDLAYYHWRTGRTCLNETSNYQPIIDPKLGLRFKQCNDRHFINVDPGAPHPVAATSTPAKIAYFEGQLYMHFQYLSYKIVYRHLDMRNLWKGEVALKQQLSQEQDYTLDKHFAEIIDISNNEETSVSNALKLQSFELVHSDTFQAETLLQPTRKHSKRIPNTSSPKHYQRERKMTSIVGTYQHERNENLDEYFKAVGVPYIPRKMMCMSNPRVEILNDTDKWTIRTISMIRTVELTFILGKQYEEHMPTGVILKNITTMEGDSLVTVSLGPDNNKIVRKYETTKDGMILTLSHEKSGQVAKRYFKRLS